ncbi:hypothetical protein GCM10010350_73320 [Streptomyces galilaeus]|nr:hypothetical protein GCM10010350_73320 [Streptomyces galilaeus]
MLLSNNYAVLHSRTEYPDFAEPERKRHLLRLWLTLLQGRDLPPHFWGDLPHAGDGSGRGGIAPRDLVTIPGSGDTGGSCRPHNHPSDPDRTDDE